MKLITYFFGNEKEWLGVFLQYLIAIILIPLAALVLLVIVPDTAQSFAFNLMNDLPYMGKATEVVQMLLQAHKETGRLSVWEFLMAGYGLINAQAAEATVIGMVTFCLQSVLRLIGFKGVPFVEHVMGLFLGTFLIQLFPWIMSDVLVLVLVAFIVLGSVLCFFSTWGQWAQKVWCIVWMATDILLVSLGFMYISWIVVFFAGKVTWSNWSDLLDLIYFIEMTSFPFMLALTVRWLGNPKDDTTLIGLLFPF